LPVGSTDFLNNSLQDVSINNPPPDSIETKEVKKVVQKKIVDKGTLEREFKKLMLNLIKHISPKDIPTLIYAFQIEKRYTINGIADIFNVLKEKGLIGPEKVQELISNFRQLGREDLVQICLEYESVFL